MTVRLLRLRPSAFAALVAGDSATAERLIGLPIPAAFAEAIDIWRYMTELVAADPLNASWLMQAVIDNDAIVGNAGFKGAPTEGVVELGYRITPERRRLGIAGAAVSLLLDEARQHRDVDAVIARISPDNLASVGVVTKAGFIQVGDHQHPRWGRQLQFEHDLSPVAH